MDPIDVPPPSPSAFNKHRPLSDLLIAQVQYFQHLHLKHPHPVDPALARDLHTEAGAARYIAAMTTSIRNRALADGKGTRPARPAQPIKLLPSRRRTVDLAAAAAPAKPKPRKPRKPKQKSPPQ